MAIASQLCEPAAEFNTYRSELIPVQLYSWRQNNANVAEKNDRLLQCRDTEAAGNGV